MKQNHNAYDINIQRCERPVIPSHTVSILAKGDHQECKRRSSARPKTAFCPTVDGLSQARLPPFARHFTTGGPVAGHKALACKHLHTRWKAARPDGNTNIF